MNNKKLGVALVVIIIAIAGAYMFPNSTIIQETKQVLGGSASPRHTEHQEFTQNFKRGGTSVATTSTAASYTLTAAELRETTGYISWTVNVNTTLTTMASTSAPFVGLKTGEAIEVFFYNASTTAASTATFAAGTGVDLQEDEGGTVIVNGLEASKLTFLKKADSDILFIVEPYQVGD